MFVVGKAVIDEEVVHARFSCDLAQCRGACCTLPGGRGAPLVDSEVAELQRAYPFAKKYLSAEHQNVIATEGLFEGAPGSYSTVCLNDRDCVLVYYEEGIARCSLEKAHLHGETAWRKPLSCHLFPIRVSEGAMEVVRYEQLSECAPARRYGEGSDMPLYDFLKEALIRRYGETWYDEFRAECRRREPPQKILQHGPVAESISPE